MSGNSNGGMDDDEEDIGISQDLERYARVTDPDKLPSPHGDVPDWFTDTDHLILHTMMFGHILTPAIIAENIDRSRGAVSRRLQTLQAGNFVEKVDRGKYSITEKGSFTVTGNPEVIESSEDDS